MVDYTNRNNRTANVGSTSYVDDGLRSHMLKVYNYMAMGLGVSGATAFLMMNVPAFGSIFLLQGVQVAITLIMLGMIFMVRPKMLSMSTSNAKIAFFSFAIILSLSISPIFAYYAKESIVRVFFITSAVFLSMSLYGYTTKKDLTGVGSFAMMGLWGVFIAGLVNIFVGSTITFFIISIVAVVAIVALTAYDTQKIKHIYYAIGQGNKDALDRAAIIGGLDLYFDFVYMFVNLMNLLGNKR